MTKSQMRIAQLDAAQLASLQSLEKELGSVVVAVEPEPAPAKLSPDQVQRLQAVEKQLGVVLVALESAG